MAKKKPAKPAKSAAKKAVAKAKPKPAAAKARAKKPEKKLPSKKAAPPAPKAKKAKPVGPRAAAPKPTNKAAPKKAKQPKVASPPAKKKPAVTPTGVAKPGLGHKWACFNCGVKFYDLGKDVPVCPKCEADQRDRPPVVAEASTAPSQPKRPSMAPMSRFLDDDEVAAPEPDEFGVAPDTDAEEPAEAAEIDIESLEEPAGLGEGGDFSAEVEEE
ncbi:MAG: FYDLN acid domain-containing protein [Deltaproteobacteria bacterium]|nr:FYDLN acid domain-containing protein [Deltaproteobacteria bacterium]